MRDPLLALDLFCGCGGLSLGLERAGFQILAAVDNWDIAINTHRLNFSHNALKAEVTGLTPQQVFGQDWDSWPKIDLIAGGPPCQGFSIQRIGKDSDPRNNLVLEFARFVVMVSPRAFLMENVTGLIGKRGESILRDFYKTISEGGYEITSTVLNAADYGVPQVRKRIFFVGWRRDCSSPFRFPGPTFDQRNYKTVIDAIGDLPEPPSRSQASDPLHFKTNLSSLNKKRLSMIPPGGGFESLPIELRANCHKNGAENIGHRYVYGRLDPNTPAATITARFDSFTRGRFGHPVHKRNISLREGARLQSFPDNFRFTGSQEAIAAQIGNAVPPVLAEALARRLAEFLYTSTQDWSLQERELLLNLS
jgi:DNA (cytosine-5)-methyltransferase 1